MSIIIVEGPDLSGKTYFIEKFSKYMNSGITIKNNFKPKNKDTPREIYKQYGHILNMSRTFSERTNRLVILDRFFPSQAVYSFFREVCELNHPTIKLLEKESVRIGVKIIYLDTPLEILKQRYDERGDEHIAKNQLEKIYLRYNKYMFNCPLRILRLNTLEDGWLETAENFVGGRNEK